jgi:hypothetical protein
VEDVTFEGMWIVYKEFWPMSLLLSLNTLLNQLVEEDKVIGSVYHYRSSYKSLINMLKRCQLRMTKYQHLRGELQYSLSFLKKEVPDIELKFRTLDKSLKGVIQKPMYVT